MVTKRVDEFIGAFEISFDFLLLFNVQFVYGGTNCGSHLSKRSITLEIKNKFASKYIQKHF